MSDAVDDIEMRLIASGFVPGEWTATEIAQVIAPEVEVLRRIRESQIEDIIALRYDLEVAREAQATIDALRALLPPAVLDACMVDGAVFVARAGR